MALQIRTLFLPFALAFSLGAHSVGAAVTQAPRPAAPKGGFKGHAPDRLVLTRPAGLRLPAGVKPTAYQANLSVSPDDERFTGHIAIDVDFAQAGRVVWLNASRLTVSRAEIISGGRSQRAQTKMTGDALALVVAKPVPAGRARIEIDYRGQINRNEVSGLFKLQDAGRWYLGTQFEDSDARRVFPCFDDPQYKTVWNLELTVPSGDLAAANTPVIYERPLNNGTKHVKFAPTTALPSYLVAFVVGPYEPIDLGRIGRAGTPARLLVPHGRTGQARFAQQSTARVLDLLEDYFGEAYPFAKLDLVALPIPRGFGAMENAGLITFEAPLILNPSEVDDEPFQEGWVSVAAHELSHQWFGDLVTMQWWNDLWLNESFATWMAQHVVDRFDPQAQPNLRRDAERQEAIYTDRLTTARQIRQPVETQDDLSSVWDAITYQKGASVLTMIEHRMGAERFKAVIRRFLTDHAGQSVRSEDFQAALVKEGGADGAELVTILKQFTERPGVPRLDTTLDCGADGQGAPRLLISQGRYLPIDHDRSAGRAAGEAPWTVPACFQYGTGGDFSEMCTTVKEARQVLPLPEGERCPGWVLANRTGDDYFVPVYSTEIAHALVKAPLLADEAVPVLDDVATLSEGGDLKPEAALAMAGRYADHRHPSVGLAALKLARTLHGELAEGADREAFARWVRKIFGGRAHQLGWTPRRDDRLPDPFLREALLPFVADVGNEPALRHEADRLAREWASGHASLGSMRSPVLNTAAAYGSRELFDALKQATTRPDPEDRAAAFEALGHFRDPTLADEALTLAGNDSQDLKISAATFDAAAADRVNGIAAVRFLNSHWDALTNRTSAPQMLRIARSLESQCDGSVRREFSQGLADRMRRLPGGQRAVAQALESMDICIAARSARGSHLHDALAVDASNHAPAARPVEE